MIVILLASFSMIIIISVLIPDEEFHFSHFSLFILCVFSYFYTVVLGFTFFLWQPLSILKGTYKLMY